MTQHVARPQCAMYATSISSRIWIFPQAYGVWYSPKSVCIYYISGLYLNLPTEYKHLVNLFAVDNICFHPSSLKQPCWSGIGVIKPTLSRVVSDAGAGKSVCLHCQSIRNNQLWHSQNKHAPTEYATTRHVPCLDFIIRHPQIAATSNQNVGGGLHTTHKIE